MGVAILIAVAVAGAWFGAFAFLRGGNPLGRLHAVTFVLLWSGTALLAAAVLADGWTVRSLKCVLIWLALVLGNACATQVCARAMYLREPTAR